MKAPALAASVASKPYAWPWHGRIAPARTALLICSGDALAEVPEEPCIRLQGVIAAVAGAGGTIVALPAAGTTVPGALALSASIFIERPRFGGFTGTALDLTLRRRGLTDLILAGFPFELGADCTMREANDLGYECLALTDCSSGLAPDTLAGAMNSIQMSGGIFGVVATAEAVIAAFAPLRPSPIPERS
jgi:hypothetical protein